MEIGANMLYSNPHHEWEINHFSLRNGTLSTCVVIKIYQWLGATWPTWLRYCAQHSENLVIQLGAVITRSNITNIKRYFKKHFSDWGITYIRTWTHKRHLISRPKGRAMECLLWRFSRKLTALQRHGTVLWTHKRYSIPHPYRPNLAQLLLVHQKWLRYIANSLCNVELAFSKCINKNIYTVYIL